MLKKLASFALVLLFALAVSCSDDDNDDTGRDKGTGGKAGHAGSDGGAQAAVDKRTYVPHASWTCGMPEGIPSIKGAQLAFQANWEVGEIFNMGRTQYGDRLLTELRAGSLNGTAIHATFAEGGLDWQLTLENGTVEVEQVNVLKTEDNIPIYLRTCGVSPDSKSEVRMVADFEAPNESAYAWLNTGSFVGIRELDTDKKTLKMSFYDVSDAAVSSDSVTVSEPEGITQQSWDCIEISGTPGEVVYTETVGLGSTISLGTSKRGRRLIVSITGGVVSGKLQGTVLSGGADYQLFSDAGYALDARYTIRTDDGELIIVRNCGLVNRLVPVFESAAAGKYAWLNENKWLSSTPELGAGSVKLTIYASQ